MNALLYLRGRKLKNTFRGMFRKPARLIYLIVILALLVLTLVGGRAADREPGHTYRDPQELAAIALALYTLMFTITVGNGFSRGGSMFSMSDVNLLFPAPLRPQIILFHGLLQQMTASLLAGIFILFQYSTLHSAYGISYGVLLFLLLGYAAAVFLGQVTAVLIYSHTNGNARRQRIGQEILYGMIGAFLLYLALNSLRDGTAPALRRAVECANGTVMRCLPVSGWLSLTVSGLLTGRWSSLVLGFGVCAAYLGFLIFLIFRTDADYYEDVLKSAEISQSAIAAKKEGTVATPQNVRVGKTGLNSGWGASVLFTKHRIENRRTQKFLLSTNALIFALTTIGFALFMRKEGILPVLLMAIYMQLFSSLLGRFNLELTRPYIYLIPEPPFRKMLWALAEEIPASLVEGIVTFVPVGFLLSLPPLEVAVCIAVRLSFTLIYVAADVVVERLWGGVTLRVLIFVLLFAVALGLAAPGCILAILAGVKAGFSMTQALLVLTACNVPTAFLALYLCRNMLQYAELNNQ